MHMGPPTLGDEDDRAAADYFNPEQDPHNDAFERYVTLQTPSDMLLPCGLPRRPRRTTPEVRLNPPSF